MTLPCTKPEPIKATAEMRVAASPTNLRKNIAIQSNQRLPKRKEKERRPLRNTNQRPRNLVKQKWIDAKQKEHASIAEKADTWPTNALKRRSRQIMYRYQKKPTTVKKNTKLKLTALKNSMRKIRFLPIKQQLVLLRIVPGLSKPSNSRFLSMARQPEPSPIQER